MSNINIIRAWKDAEYRKSLSAEELAMLPENPAGEVVLKDEDLASMIGAGGPHSACVVLTFCQSAVVSCHC
jgi:mersacidin/lichenicidin family type 2 lantibiotic